MSDAAFATAAYPSYTTKELLAFISAGRGNEKMVAEVARRDRVAAGDVSVMTSAERLRRVTK